MDSFSIVFFPRLANFMKSIITAFSISALCAVMRLTVYLCTAAEGDVCIRAECPWLGDCVFGNEMRRRISELWR